MRLLSLFSGIGSFERALTNLDISYELVGFSEVDEWATESYCKIHGVDQALNLGDVSKIDENDISDVDMITYGFPCTDVSTAGKEEGIKEGTSSGLLYDAERIIKSTKPKYAIAENVKNLIGKRHKEDFNKLLSRLDSYGYNNYWDVLNAKDFGVPQSRERIFIVSIRKDIDDGNFKFPTGGGELSFKLEDIVDFNKDRPMNVSLKPYLDEKYHRGYRSNNGIVKVFDGNTQGYFTSDYTGRRIYSIYGISPTITTRNIHSFKELSGRLSPRESLLLMGFKEEDYEAIKHMSNRQIFRQAGNSIVVDVLEAIFKNLFK